MPTLCDQIRTLIDETSSAVFWPNAHIYDAANEAVMDVYAEVQPVEGTSTMTFTTSGDLFALPETDLMVPKYLVLAPGVTVTQTWDLVTQTWVVTTQSWDSMTAAGGTGIAQRYWISSQAELEQYSREWRTATRARPSWFILWGLNKLRVWPSPDQNYVFYLYGVPWPTEIGTGTEDLTTTDRMLKLAIAYRAAAELFAATRPDLSEAWRKEADECILRYKKRYRNYQPHNIRRLRPANPTQIGMKGHIKTGSRLG
jgi:hypothetical protein